MTTEHELTMGYTPAGSPADVANGFSESCSCGWSGVWRHGGDGARTWAIEDGDQHLNRAAYAQVMRNIRRASAPPLPPPNRLLEATVDGSPAVPLNDPPS
jgi:hypothetical protein